MYQVQETNDLIVPKPQEVESISKRTLCGIILAVCLGTFLAVWLVLINKNEPSPLIKVEGLEFTGRYSEHSRKVDGNVETVNLVFSDPGQYYRLNKSRIWDDVQLSVIRESPRQLRFIISKKGEESLIPDEFPFPYTKDSYGNGTSQEEDLYIYELYQNDRLFKLTRKDGTVLFDSFNIQPLLSDLYIELNNVLDTPYVWGFGERRVDSYLLPSGEYTTWNYDNGDVDHSKPAGQQYGTHPVWLQRGQDSQYHITLLKTSRPFVLEYEQGSEMKFKVVGGVIDFKIIVGDNDVKDVIREYHRYINGWRLHPFWASGFHQSRWGFTYSQDLLDVVANYSKYDLPLDTVWNDLDYMANRVDFTLNKSSYSKQQLKELTTLTNPQGVHWVPIVDPGVEVSSKCAKLGKKYGIFLQSNKNYSYIDEDEPLIGCVWPGRVYYPDFNHPESIQVWHQCHKTWIDTNQLKPSGIWIDMNENSNFVDGELDPNDDCPSYNGVGVQEKSQSSADYPIRNTNITNLNDLPFDPQGTSTTLETHTISIDAIHYSEQDALYFRSTPNNSHLTELDLHSFNGFMESIATQESQRRFQDTNLTFILTRSTIFGSGRFVSHWFGDNKSDWQWLKSSVVAMFNFNLFGIPMSGDDICGFNNNATAQLCARWLALGAFYPFSRSHNSIFSTDQFPYSFEPEYPYVLKATRASLNLRYSLLKFYYTLFITQRDDQIEAGAGTIIDPLFYHFDDPALLTIDTQFIIGNSIIVNPVVDESANNLTNSSELTFYVPNNAYWFSYEDGSLLNNGTNHTVTRLFEEPAYLLLNIGQIIPISNVTNIYRTRHLSHSINLLITLQSTTNYLEQNVYSAQGSYLAIGSYENDNVESRCWSQSNSCHRSISLVGLQIGQEVVLEIENTAGSENDKSEEIFIKQLVIYGLQKNGVYIIHRQNVHLSSLNNNWIVSFTY